MADGKAELWKCGHTRKCKWQGTREELQEVPDKEIAGLKRHACPRCGNDEFYVVGQK